MIISFYKIGGENGNKKLVTIQADSIAKDDGYVSPVTKVELPAIVCRHSGKNRFISFENIKLRNNCFGLLKNSSGEIFIPADYFMGDPKPITTPIPKNLYDIVRYLPDLHTLDAFIPFKDYRLVIETPSLAPYLSNLTAEEIIALWCITLRVPKYIGLPPNQYFKYLICDNS